MRVLVNTDLPIYWAAIFVAPRVVDKATNGDDRKDTNIGPMKVLGTTPGNSWWSYWERIVQNQLLNV